MNYPSAFYQQFFDSDGTPLAGGFLRSVVSGTDTDSTTYLDNLGGASNTNPIVLDASGRCVMFLDPTVVYDLILKRADGTAVKTFDDVSAAAAATSVTTTVNGLSGAVSLTAEDIPFTTTTSTTWLGTPANVADALDSIITHADTISAASAGIYTPTLVNIANVASSSVPGTAQWMRVLNVVTVSGIVNVTPTAASGTDTQISMSLPVASVFTGSTDLAGTAVLPINAVASGWVRNNASNAAQLEFAASSTSPNAWAYTYTYVVR